MASAPPAKRATHVDSVDPPVVRTPAALPSERPAVVPPAAAARVASDEAVDKAIERATSDHRKLVKALAK